MSKTTKDPDRIGAGGLEGREPVVAPPDQAKAGAGS